MIRKVAVIMGSDSDWPVVKGACAQLKALDILALGDEALADRLEAERTAMAQQIAAKEEKLQKEIEEL